MAVVYVRTGDIVINLKSILGSAAPFFFYLSSEMMERSIHSTACKHLNTSGIFGSVHVVGRRWLFITNSGSQRQPTGFIPPWPTVCCVDRQPFSYVGLLTLFTNDWCLLLGAWWKLAIRSIYVYSMKWSFIRSSVHGSISHNLIYYQFYSLCTTVVAFLYLKIKGL